VAIGQCRFELCRNALGSEFRLPMASGEVRLTLLCSEHERLADQWLKLRRAGQAPFLMRLTDEGIVYRDTVEDVLYRDR
jgi:hypothetical protein